MEQKNERMNWACLSFTALLNMSHDEIVAHYLEWRPVYIEAINKAEDSQEFLLWCSCLQLMEDEIK